MREGLKPCKAWYMLVFTVDRAVQMIIEMERWNYKSFDRRQLFLSFSVVSET